MHGSEPDFMKLSALQVQRIIDDVQGASPAHPDQAVEHAKEPKVTRHI